MSGRVGLREERQAGRLLARRLAKLFSDAAVGRNQSSA